MASPALPDRYKPIFFVPPQDLATCKEAVLAAGAGKFPAYSEALTNFDLETPPILPLGKELQEIGEVRCETTCNGKENTQAAVAALKKVHPYEVPVYEVYKLEDF